MKFFTSSIVAFGLIGASVLTSASVIPVAKRDVAAPIEKRTVDLPTAISIATELYDKIKTYTGAINATSKGITPTSSVLDVTAAGAEIDTAILSLTSLITEYTSKISIPSKRDVIQSRQAATGGDLAGVIANILIEISSALNLAIGAIGLGGLVSGTLGGLVTALSGLLLALVPVVNNLLALVQTLLDGLLVGLSAALAGLVV